MDIVKELQDLARKTQQAVITEVHNTQGLRFDESVEKMILKALTEAYDMGYYDSYVDLDTTWEDFNKIISGDKK